MVIVTIRAFDDVPEHRFEVLEVHEDCVTGFALTGPFAGEYGEPPIELVVFEGQEPLAGMPHIPESR
ncbi:hypothetical protein [Thalassobius vesicularis]|uniref:hypothetical protein n=1 Tax=Thalassobius vesicularis TaxID=1294297 RepID=UPI001454C2B9|nr:hypothetical protein [Thalassobius vesicularis]